MDKKLIALLAIAALITMSLGAGLAYWYTTSTTVAPHSPSRSDRPERSTLKETGTIDLFGLVMPGRQDADENTAIVRADLQIVVPLRYRLKVEKETPKIREIIASILRNSDVPEINRDGLVGFKQQIIHEVRRQLGIEISEILVLRFSYDIINMHVQRYR